MLRFLDSFDHYATGYGDILQKWTTSPFNPEIVAGGGTCGSNCAHFEVFGMLVKGINYGSTTVGFGHWLTITLAAVGAEVVMGGVGHTSARHVFMARNYDGSLTVYRNDGASNTSLGTTAPDVIRVSDAYYVEMKTTIHNSTGTVDVWVNGVNVLSLTGQDTQNGSSSSVRTLWMGNEAGNGNTEWDIDDLYTFDSVAGEVDDVLGPVRVEWLKADGIGTHTGDFTNVGGASEWQSVRDVSGPDDDTTYITSATVGHQHTSTMGNTSLPAGTIYGVQALIHARVTDAGFRGIKPLFVQGGSDYLGTEQYPGTSYRYLHEVFETDPDTSAAWDIAGVNSVQLGVEVTS